MATKGWTVAVNCVLLTICLTIWLAGAPAHGGKDPEPCFSEAPTTWSVAAGGNGHVYQALCDDEGISWGDANTSSAATAPNCSLATIASAEENAFVASLLDESAWIGGTQTGGPEPAGGWTWVTGEPFTYTNWDPAGEPNDNPAPENCLELYDVGVWNDANCETGFLGWYIVECGAQVSAVEVPAISPTGGSLLAASLLLAALYVLRAARRRRTRSS